MATKLADPRGRRPTNVSLSASAVAEARSFGMNVSAACEKGLVEAVKLERERRWRHENAAAIESFNAYVERHGIPLSEYQQF